MGLVIYIKIDVNQFYFIAVAGHTVRFMNDSVARQRNNGTNGPLLHPEINSDRLLTKPDTDRNRGRKEHCNKP
jgi:hypothetical protein